MTESQIKNDSDLAETKEQLSTFEIYFNSCGVRHKNLAFCLGQNIVLSKHETFPGISVIDITKNNSVFLTIQYVMLYRSPSSFLEEPLFFAGRDIVRDQSNQNIQLK